MSVPLERPTAGAGEPRRLRHALVLSGGGANGAYEVGILKALANGKCRGLGVVEPDFFFGTSIGSFNAAFLLSQWSEYGPAAVANLERTWMEDLSGDAGNNGVYRFRGDPAYYLNPNSYLPNPLTPLLEILGDGAYLSWEGLQRAVGLVTTTEESLRERIVNLFDFSAFLATEKWEETIRRTISFASIRSEDKRKLKIFATNWATGELRAFENRHMTDQLGPLAIRASSAVPGIFPQVYVGAEPYVDGGVLMNTPLTPALEEGADVIHAIYLDPDIASIPLRALDSTVAANYRLQAISWAALVNQDIDRVARINRGLSAFARLQAGETLGQSELETLARGVVMVLGGFHLSTYRPITVHRFHPREELSGGALGLLDLAPEHLKDLIYRGFTDATLHNCVEEGCVLPDPRLLAADGSVTLFPDGRQ